MSKPLSVLLTTEGTYPFFEGGVSTWCDVLIRQLPQVKFTLLSLTAQPGMQPVYTLPENVTGCISVPLWGTGGANEVRTEVGFRKLANMRHRLTRKVMSTTFATAFQLLLTGLLDKNASVNQTGEGMRRLAKFFSKYDYDVAFRHPVTWQLFKNQITRCTKAWKQEVPEAWPPSLNEVVEALRLLYRWLTPLALPIPETDVTHSSASGLSSIPCIVARLERGTPFLLTEHGIYMRERYIAWSKEHLSPFTKFFMTQVTRRMVELCYATADVISPVAAWNRRWELQLGATYDQVVPIANGIDPNRFSPQPMPAEETPTLVWVGRIDPLKDLLTLFDAMALVHEVIPNVKLLLFGKAPNGGEWYDTACRERQRELGLDSVIQFMGFAKSPEAAYSQGHAAVLSSISEGQPFSVIEAMFCGRPVVGTEVGGVPEVIEHTGRVVLPKDPRALADACIEMLRDLPRCEQLGKLARARALANYTLQKSVGSYEEMYHRLLEEPLGVSVSVPEPIKVPAKLSGVKKERVLELPGFIDNVKTRPLE